MSCYVIATSRSWNESLGDSLSHETENKFVVIQSQEDLTLAKLRALNPQMIFFPHWSYILPKEIYNEFECVMFHMTDLPFGRGGSPLQNLIQRGMRETKVSAFKCEAGVDTGPVYLKKALSLEGRAEDIFLRCRDVIKSMIREIVLKRPKPEPQKGDVVKFERRTPEQSKIEGNETIETLYDHIRMLDAPGYPHAFIEVGDLRIELTHAEKKDGTLTANAVIKEKR